jgi:hypothetical protein
MGKSLAVCAMLLVAAMAFATDPPDAPSATRAKDLRNSAALSTSPASTFDIDEFAVIAPVTAPDKKVVDKKFLALTGVATVLTVMDFEMTQHCLGNHTCAESDPLMPTSRAGMYASSAPVNAALYYWSYRWKKQGKRLWWVPTAAAIASHAVGVGTNIRFLK